MNHLQNIVKSEKYTKIDHDLTNFDLNSRDRQNYRSCIELTSNGVSNVLITNPDTLGTYTSLPMLIMLIKIYIVNQHQLQNTSEYQEKYFRIKRLLLYFLYEFLIVQATVK